jgi:putative acetyltransferase
MSAPALRPYLPSDAPVLAAIFAASVEELTADDYTEDQRAAWASIADDEEAFAQRLGARLTLVATIDGAPVGFAALEGADAIDLLYVLPSAAGLGVGALLCDALEKLGAARGAKKMTVDASDTAEPFFRKRGYVPQSRNTRIVADEWLANTTMTKDIAPAGAPGQAT